MEIQQSGAEPLNVFSMVGIGPLNAVGHICWVIMKCDNLVSLFVLDMAPSFLFYCINLTSSALPYMYGIQTWLTHRGQANMDTISQRTFSNAFSLMKMFEFQLKFHWGLFLRVQLTTNEHWLGNGLAPNRWQAITWTNDDPVQWRITRPQWVNPLRPSDAYMCR